MTKKQTVTLPAVTVEIPRMGMVVYISPRVGFRDGKHAAMLTAEIVVNDIIELQSFHFLCKNKMVALNKIKSLRQQLEKNGPFIFIQTSI